MSTYNLIYAVVRQIPSGKVATYGQVAELANLPRQARLVGYALYKVDPQSPDIPWHRVINAKGEISTSPFRYGTEYLQRSLLEQEGIEFSPDGKINLHRYRWQPDWQPDMREGWEERVGRGGASQL
ncbi:MGMT family protein [Thermocoleostomius sinensis]|jgi:methylated-DNA-protein-cysteine methyltransferase-like protein|uniref:MGMT family protein n=1 Tax=Thermocoleostomius sinensis A174 TaxID=2016057 RepID=A0A9E9C5Z8_9CYAN|nr:MGMT family protein [Thermocoleostomius sinensis]WAL58714.1 MGMT family protein [Thermocoleostomius sinensis A174]